jgi:RNA polymerase subunit RPABC4/transcription elongation factor Spt4
MKYCYQCGRLTAGEPLFCGTCGRTYDVKLCPRLHVNPRGAEVCSKCGSRELSTPQPKIPVTLRLLAFVTRIALGLLLFYATLCLVIALLRTPEVQKALVALGTLLGCLWWLWSKLPDWFQEAIRSLWKNRRRQDDE